MWRSNVPKRLPIDFSQAVSQSLANALLPSQQKKKNVTNRVKNNYYYKLL